MTLHQVSRKNTVSDAMTHAQTQGARLGTQETPTVPDDSLHLARPNRYLLPLSILIALVSSSCGDGQMMLGNGTFSVTVPRHTNLHCEILQHASSCNDYNVPGSIEGMEVRRCQGESANTRFLIVTGKYPENFEPDSGERYLAGFTNAWSQCLDSHTQSSKEIEIEGKTGMEFGMRTPLGNGTSRAFDENGYAIMVLAVPKHKGAAEEIQQFIASMRPLKTK